MAKYTVTDPVKHAGKRHAPGASLDLTPEQAAPLIAVGAIALDRKAAEKAAAEKAAADKAAANQSGKQA